MPDAFAIVTRACLRFSFRWSLALCVLIPILSLFEIAASLGMAALLAGLLNNEFEFPSILSLIGITQFQFIAVALIGRSLLDFIVRSASVIVEEDVRRSIAEAVMRSYVGERPLEALVGGADAEKFRNFVDTTHFSKCCGFCLKLIKALMATLVLSILVLIMLGLSVSEMALLFILISFFAVVTFPLIKKQAARGRKKQKLDRYLVDLARATFSNIEMIRINRLESVFGSFIRGVLQNLRILLLKDRLLSMVPSAIGELGIVLAALLFVVNFAENAASQGLSIKADFSYATAVVLVGLLRLMPLIKIWQTNLVNFGFRLPVVLTIGQLTRLDLSTKKQKSSNLSDNSRIDTKSIFKIDDGQLIFRGETTVGVVSKGFEAKQGDWVGITGPSGSGKTTLIDQLIGARLTGRAGGASPSNGGALPIGFVPQITTLMPGSVVDNVKFFRELPDSQVKEALGLVELDYFYKNPTENAGSYWGVVPVLSGGETLRVGIARALAGAPELLILDESLANVDLDMRMRILFRLKTMANLTVVFVSHDQMILDMCSGVVVVESNLDRH